jgi:hypothetical protein
MGGVTTTIWRKALNAVRIDLGIIRAFMTISAKILKQKRYLFSESGGVGPPNSR